MAPRRVKKVNKFDYKKLSANDVICPICRSILIKPITLPCSHGFCSSCFETTTQNANVVCPLCRVRVGSWLRSATKSKKIVNEALWQAIQELFPQQVRNKLKGMNENFGDKYKIKQLEDSNDNSIKINEKITNLKQNDLQKNNNKINISKKNETINTNPSTSTNNTTLMKAAPKTANKNLSLTSEKNEKRPNFFLNNFATKEYTCRILCQNVSSKDAQKKNFKESQVSIQKKNKRIQEITKSEKLNDRSNSIESECLYFKPIDYRHNPPSEGLAPIKVPTRKPNVSPNIKILAPSGQNQFNMNHLESAFARLCSPVISDEKLQTYKKENSQVQKGTCVISTKRKYDKSENKAKKKVKTIANQSLKSKESMDTKLTKVCDTDQCKNSCKTDNLISEKTTNNKQSPKSLMNEEYIKRSLQEQADFELATKLQQTYNQSSKYSTRSSVLKLMAAKNQVQIEGIMTPYKVN